MSSPVSERLLQLLADRKIKLREEDIAFLQAFSLEERNNHNPVTSQTVRDSQLVRSIALLLKRLLEQHRLRSAGWQRPAYCRMVHTAATAMHSVCRRILYHGELLARMRMSQQLAASGALQQIPATLVKLSGLMQSTTATDPSIKAAHAVLAAVAIIIAAWPGAAGVLSSQDAGPLALPAVKLASILEQQLITQAHPDRFQLCTVVRVLVTALAGQIVAQNDPYQQYLHHQQLAQSPAFLRLLLTFIAVDLEPIPTQDVAGNAAGAPATPAGVEGPAGQQLTAAVAAAAADTPCLSDQNQASSSMGGCSTTAVAYKEAAEPAGCSHSSDSLQAAPAAPAAVGNAPEQQTSNIGKQQLLLLQHLHPAMQLSSSARTLTTVLQVLNFRGGDSCGVSQLISMIAVAAQCVECIARALREFEDSSHATSNSSSSGGNKAQRTWLCLSDGSITAALLVLPPLLLHIWNWPVSKEKAAAAPALYSAVSKLVCKAIRCWELQLWLHATGLPHGVCEGQLPIAQLLDLLLWHLESAVQQQRSSQAAATSSDTSSTNGPLAEAANRHSFIELLTMLGSLQTVTSSTQGKPGAAVACMLEQGLRMSSDSSSSSSSSGNGCCGLVDDPRLPYLCDRLISFVRRHLPEPGSSQDGLDNDNRRTYHSDPGLVLLAAQSAAAGSREQQQLLTLLISIMKRAHMLPKQVKASKGAPGQLTALHGCRLCRVPYNAARWMLPHHTGSSSSESLLFGGSAAGLAAAVPWLVVLGRNLVNLAGQLDAILGYDPTCDSWAWYFDQDCPFKKRHGSQLLRCSEALCDWASCVSGTVDGLVQGGYGATGHSSWVGGAAPATQDTAAAGAGMVALPQEATAAAAAVGASSADAVSRQQSSQLLLVQQQLESDVRPKLKELEELCRILYNIYISDPLDPSDKESAQRMLEKLKKLAAVPTPGLAAAATAMLAVEDSAAELVLVLQQWGIQQLQQQLLDLGSQVCAALPLSGCCNNPGCSNMRGDSESALVSGKGCVCAGCEVARYCGRECQAAHWQQHKAICKFIKRQKMSMASV